MKTEIDDTGMQAIAELLETVMPDGWGFTLLTFETNRNPAKVKYISSAERESMIGTVKTMLDKWEAMKDFKNPNLN